MAMTRMLEKCPFCGTDQNVDHEYADYAMSPNMAAAQKHCWNCGAAGPAVFVDDYESMVEWQRAADELWNERSGDGDD